MKAVTGWAVLASCVLLVACGDQPQELAGAKIDGGAPAWQGTDGHGNPAPGWTPGDAKKWDEQLRNRTQRGQNEYTRTAGAS